MQLDIGTIINLIATVATVSGSFSLAVYKTNQAKRDIRELSKKFDKNCEEQAKTNKEHYDRINQINVAQAAIMTKLEDIQSDLVEIKKDLRENKQKR